MKKILIFSHALELGGAERALLGLLEALDTSEYQVELFLMRHEGELMKYIPKNIRLLPEKLQYTSLAVPLKTVLKKRQFGVALGRATGKHKAKQYTARHHIASDNGIGLEYSHKYTCCFMPMVSDEMYDLAISFLTPHYFVAEKVHAKKKIAWIHTDYSKLQIDTESELAMWGKYDYIASISDSVTRGFLQQFPSLRNEIVSMENIMVPEWIRHNADVDVSDEMSTDGRMHLLSIGRYCNAKNFDNIPDICARLIQAGLDVKWYIIGYGGDEPLIRQRIADAYMEDHVILLGKKENPYPYIKACDLYVQPSRYEGKCVTVREAQILGKPVVITRYATSSSQLEDGVDGVIVPMDNEGCAEGIAALLQDPKKMRQLSETCRNRDYSNASEVEKIYQLMEG